MTPITHETEMCARGGGTMREYSSTCGDDCELRVLGEICGQALTYQCDCGPGRCFSGWECVTDACAPLYSPAVLDALAAEPMHAQDASIQTRLDEIELLPLEEQKAAMRELRVWLMETFRSVRFHLRGANNKRLELEDFERHQIQPLSVLIEVRLIRDIKTYRVRAKSNWSLLGLLRDE